MLSRLTRSALALGLLTLVCRTLVAADDAAPIKVGIYGLDNYQSVAFTQLFNSPKAEGDLAGFKVISAVPTVSPDIPESVDALPKWEAQIQKFGVEIDKNSADMLKKVDCVIMTSLDGRTHLKQATEVLKAGKRLFIARPLAASLADAVAIFEVSKQTGTPCFSSSQHRFSPGFSGMRNFAEVGDVLGCDVYGGFQTDPSHPEFVWHAVHSIDTLYTIMGPGVETVQRTSTPKAESVTAVWKDGRVATYRGIKEGKPKYSATVFGANGVSTAGIYGHGMPAKGVVPTNDKYMGYEGILIEVAKFFKTGKPPVSPAETIEVFAFMEACHESKRQGGVVVKLEDVLKSVKK